MNSSTIAGLVPALALTLLHTLWQGAAAAGLLWAMLRMVPSARSRLRYALAAGTLLVTAAGGALTLIACWPVPPSSGTNGQVPVSGRLVVVSDAAETAGRGSEASGHPIPQAGLSVHTLSNGLPAAAADVALNDTARISQPAISNPTTATASSLARIPMLHAAVAGGLWMPWAVGLWSLGVLIGLIKLAANWQVLRHWRRQAQPCADGSWNRLFSRLLRKMGLAGKVRLLVSSAAPVPLVIGWLRPVVLVPAQLFTGLTTGQLEALLIHELAHIRRHDFLVNLLQSGIGIFYFHHPCVRWISSQIRAEREHCCDDTATVLCGGPLPYARALAALEDLRPGDTPALYTAATGSPLIGRLQRLLVPTTPVSTPPIWPAVLGTTALAVLLIGIPWAQADDKQAADGPAAQPSNEAVETPSTPAAQPAPDSAPSKTVTPSVREKQAMEVVTSFLSAPTAEDKIRWLLQDDETRNAAETFFKRHPEFAQTVEGTRFGPVMLHDEGGAWLAMEIPSLQGTYFFMIQPTEPGPRIDLLRSTYYQRMHFQDIQNEMPEIPVRVRAILHPGDYYNKAFADKARYRCYELNCPGVDRRFYAYEPITPSNPPEESIGESAAPLENVDLNPQAGLQTLEIKYPSSGKDPLQVEIVRILPREVPPAIPFQLRSRKLESLRPKIFSNFHGPALSLKPSEESPDPRPAMLRDFGEAAFDKVALAPAETRIPAPEITVSVIKAGSRTRMPAFSLFVGQCDSGGGILWLPTPPMRGEGGEFPLTRKNLPDQGALRIEAEDSIPREYTWENKAHVPDEVSFELDTDFGTEGQVSLPDGSPAAEAIIAVALPGRYAVLEHGRLRSQDETPSGKPQDAGKSPWDAWARPRIRKADARGRFLLPTETDLNATVLIVHEAGVLEIPYADFALRPQARLKPWAKVTGQVLWSGKPGSDTPVLLSPGRLPGFTPVTVVQYGQATADADGRFVFEKALPGMIRVSCPLKTAPEAPWPLDIVLAGRETLAKAESGSNTLLVGGRGRIVKGLLRGRDSWEGVTFSIALQDPPEGIPDNETRRQVFEKFRNSPEGAPFFRTGLKPSADGSFEILGILPGTYRIFATIPGGDGTPVSAGTLVRIDQESPNEPPAPVDIGELPLTTAPVSKP